MKTISWTMKTGALLGAVALGTALVPIPQAQAADRDWAVAGKILAGVAAADILFNHLPAVTAPAPTRVVETRVYQTYPSSTVRIVEDPYVYCPPPRPTVVYTPPPTVTYVPPPTVVYETYTPPPVVVVRPCPPPVVYSSISIGVGTHHGHHPWVGGIHHRSHAW